MTILFSPPAPGRIRSISAARTGELIVQSDEGGTDSVIAGSLSPSLGGTLSNIHGPVYIYDQTQTALTLDDSGDTSTLAKTVTFGFDGTYKTVSGLAPATFDYVPAPSPGAIGVSQLNVFGGRGDEAFDWNSPLLLIPVFIDGGGGTNALTVDDRAEATGQTYDITSNTVTRTGATPLGYSNFAGLTLYAGGAGNVIGVASTAAGTTSNIYGGAGNDEFLVTGNSTLDGTLGPLNLHGGGGTGDFVVFSDNLNPVGQTYTLTANTLTRSGIAPITFDPMTQVILYTGSGIDHVNVQSVAAGTSEPIVIGTGDILTVGSLAPRQGGTLSDIQGTVRAQAYAGQAPSVIIDDSGDAASHPQASFQTDAYGYHLTGLSPARSISSSPRRPR